MYGRSLGNTPSLSYRLSKISSTKCQRIWRHHTTLILIISPVTVVRGRPHGEDCFIKMPLESLHDQLVGATYHVYVVGMVKVGNNVTSKQKASTARTYTPTGGI